MSAPRGASSSYGFMVATGLDVHRSGKATVDHFDERSKQLQAIRVMHRFDALDLVPMLFAPPEGPINV